MLGFEPDLSTPVQSLGPEPLNDPSLACRVSARCPLVAERNLVAHGKDTLEERTKIGYKEEKYDLRNILKLKETQRQHHNVNSFLLLSTSFESDSPMYQFNINKVSPT